MGFHVFIQLTAVGDKTVTITALQSTDTVATLVQRLADKEALEADGITLVFRGKQLSDTTAKLSVLGIKARSNLFVAFKVLGGMAQVYVGEDGGMANISTVTTQNNASNDVGDGNARKYDISEAAKFGVTPTKSDCFVKAHIGCNENSVTKLIFQECDHVYCSDCVYLYLNSAVCMNRKTELACADTGCGASFNMDALFVAAALTETEISKFEKQLNKNYLGVVCPNDKCKAYLLLDGISTNKVQCRKCKSNWFCKICKIDWPNDSGTNYTICGNPDCMSSAEIFEALENCAKKDYGIEKQVPSLRVCNKCRSFVEWAHGVGCKHSTCKRCDTKFCFVCLKKDHTCNLGIPCVVKIQTDLN